MASSLNVKTIVLALRKTFNIRTGQGQAIVPYVIKDKYIEVSSTCKVSQNADELISYAHRFGFTIPLPDFLPYNRWACVELNRIKILWSSKHTDDTGGSDCVLSGAWVGNIFYPTLEDPDIVVAIECTDGTEGTIRTEESLTLRSINYRIIHNVADSAPLLKLGETRFQCMGAFCLYNIFMTNKGIYINRTAKNTDISTRTEDIQPYNLTLQYKGKLLFRS